MVIRRERRSRKLHRTRVWGHGNKKNARGKGTRGGVGNAGARKSKFTRMTAKHPELIRKRGFVRFGAERRKEITLAEISRMVASSGERSVELRGFTVLSNGSAPEGITIRARRFTARAIEKIGAANSKAEAERSNDEAS